MNNYYSIPFDAKTLIVGKRHNGCSLNQSIAHHIHLINTSYFGECSFDETFGCKIWEMDFDNLKTTHRLAGLIQESVIESLKIHEKRLTKIDLIVKLKQEELFVENSDARIKKRVDLTIKGKVKKTNEDFSYVEYFFLAPLSY